ncbi:MAG: hypothetical protein NCA08_07395 [Deltaproteobacteria bacterium]|nr:hypothetical protein [Candidatus Deferrimicrobium borealis]
MKRWMLFLVVLLSVTVLLAPTTQAADEVAGRVTYHTQKVETMEVGDVPGHILGCNQSPGLAFYTKGPDAGKIATRLSTTCFDVVNGKGTATGYTVNTFEDGSTLIYTINGTTTPLDGGKRTAMEGTNDVTGTGRYKETKMKCTWKGERVGLTKTGGDGYADFTCTILK